MSLSAPAQASLDRWHAAVAARDIAAVAPIVAPNAVFRSPMAHAPYPGREQVVLILSLVMTVFEDFCYEREFVAGAHSVGLEFSARIGDKQLKGIDLIRFDEDGMITEVEVMVRPASALMALGEIMGRKLAAARA